LIRWTNIFAKNFVPVDQNFWDQNFHDRAHCNDFGFCVSGSTAAVHTGDMGMGSSPQV